MLDVVIRGGTVVEAGAPAPPRRRIRDGRIVAGPRRRGERSRDRRRWPDRRPGFVDPHTHYDAQLLWDAAATPSCFHGVTTVIGGNCGFSVAPIGGGDIDYIRRLLARVEGMPLAALESGLAWDWRSMGDYLDRIEGATAVNAGFLVGRSALRRAVMGDDAVGTAASPEQIDAMRELLGASLRAGGLGFSSSQNTAHTDGDARPVPSRAADRAELLALASVVGDHAGTTLEFITAGCLNELSDAVELMADRWSVGVRSMERLTVNLSARTRRHQLASDRRPCPRGEVGADDAGRWVPAAELPHVLGAQLAAGLGDGSRGPVPERIAVDPPCRWLVERAEAADAPFACERATSNGQTHAAEAPYRGLS
jgi:N-acyl-D-aspartate/D-glutamate deacylase